MYNLFEKVINLIIFINRKMLEAKYRVKFDTKKTCAIGTTKHVFAENATLELVSKTNAMQSKMLEKVKKIVSANLKTPEKLLKYIENHGTKVVKIKNADVILAAIKEDEGFITELKGFKAFYLNFMINWAQNKSISIKFKTEPMFVLRDLPVDVYYMAHQFYKWYGFKMKLAGYDCKTQENFKKTFQSLSNNDISKLSLEEIIAVKEAVKRDNEAIEFVLSLCRENSTSKKVLDKIMKFGAATV